MAEFSVIILAAGKGTRMATPLPKVLHPVAGVPMIYRVVSMAKSAGAKEVRVVVGFGEQLVRQVVEPLGAVAYKQLSQQGTADAVRAADVESLKDWVVICNGDHPLIQVEDLRGLVNQVAGEKLQLAVVTTEVKRPGEFGRIVRHGGLLATIVEARDASPETLKIKEINSGMYIVRAEILKTLLPYIKNTNTKREYYLTDIVELAREAQYKVDVVKAPRRLAFGVNSQRELAKATKFVFRHKCRQLMDNGVIIMDPDNTYIEESVKIGAGSVVYPGVLVKGSTTIGTFCVLEPNVFINASEIGDGVQIRAGSYIEQSEIGPQCMIGPYARIRPDTNLSEEVHIGNFVELKKAKLGRGSKAGHLSYLGDVEIGSNTNIGCGTITCNYATDRKKYKTEIGDNVFVGSDTQFVAPLKVGDGAVIGSGSTITKDVPANALAVARGRQIIKENYAQKLSESKSESKESTSAPTGHSTTASKN